MATAVRRQARSPQPIQRWSPFSDIEQLQQQMEQLIQAGLPGAQGGDGERPWIPHVDIEETEDSWILEAEIPGASKDDVNVEMRDNELIITGEIKEKERKGILRRRTRRVGEFEFRATLPGDVDPEKIDANLDDGVLTVRVPKAERARARRIEVQSGAAQPAAGQEQAG